MKTHYFLLLSRVRFCRLKEIIQTDGSASRIQVAYLTVGLISAISVSGESFIKGFVPFLFLWVLNLCSPVISFKQFCALMFQFRTYKDSVALFIDRPLYRNELLSPSSSYILILSTTGFVCFLDFLILNSVQFISVFLHPFHSIYLLINLFVLEAMSPFFYSHLNLLVLLVFVS